ncbi:MAG: branched-chain amino acid ABC transporter permease [Trueperaceae bacterium]
MTFREKHIRHIVQPNRNRNILLSLAAFAVLLILLFIFDRTATSKLEQALALFAIWSIATVSLNLINGITGILSLGHHGFMLLGGYTTSLLILAQEDRDRMVRTGRSLMNDFTLGLSAENLLRSVGLGSLAVPEMLWLHYLIALLIGGCVAALFGFIVSLPALRLRGDYLAIVTFGFGEVIRLLISTRLLSPFTNGSQGFSGIPSEFGKGVWWTFGILAITVFMMSKLKFSSYGRALMAIREDEIAAQAMGVNLPYHKMLAFVVSAFFAGIAGGLYVSWLASTNLDVFPFTLTFFFLVAISVGGTGSITGVLIGTALVVFVRQYGDFIEETYLLSNWTIALGVLVLIAALGTYIFRRSRRLRPQMHVSIYVLIVLSFLCILAALVAPSMGLLTGTFRGFGLRSILLAVLLVVIMIFRPAGVLGSSEFSWAWLFREHRDEPTDEERKQDAWLSNAELNRPGGAAGADKVEG